MTDGRTAGGVGPERGRELAHEVARRAAAMRRRALPVAVDDGGDAGRTGEGVLNPYGLAERVIGMAVPWERVESPSRLLEAVFGRRCSELFDAEGRGPLHARSAGAARRRGAAGGAPLRYRDRRIAWTHDPERLERVLDEVLPRDDGRAAPEGPAVPREGRGPGGITWVDRGGPARRGAAPLPGPGAVDVSDPVQGSLGDCWLVAALAALAWTWPERIRWEVAPSPAGGPGARVVVLHDEAAGGAVRVPVTRAVPVWAGSGLPVLGRGDDPGESWPAIYEKAVAAHLAGDPGGRPDLRVLAFGQAARALRLLTGEPTATYDLAGLSEADVLDLLRSVSPQAAGSAGRVAAPVVAWTWPGAGRASAATGARVAYADPNLVARHAYTVLGWTLADGRDAVVLRNPFGRRDLAAPSVADATPGLAREPWATLSARDPGVIAVDLARFRTHFRRLALVETPWPA